MKAWQNTTLQVLLSLIQVGNFASQVSGSGLFGSGKTPLVIAAVTGGLQIVAARVASWYNPDGTPSTTAYQAPAKK